MYVNEAFTVMLCDVLVALKVNHTSSLAVPFPPVAGSDCEAKVPSPSTSLHTNPALILVALAQSSFLAGFTTQVVNDIVAGFVGPASSYTR